MTWTNGIPWDRYEQQVAEVTGERTCGYCGVVGHSRDYCLPFWKSRCAELVGEAAEWKRQAWSRPDRVLTSLLWFVAGVVGMYLVELLK